MRSTTTLVLALLLSAGLAASDARAACEDCVDFDGQDCTEPVCQPDGSCVIEDHCTEICRGPGFWATRGGAADDGENLLQVVLDQTGPMILCRRAVGDGSSTGSLSSMLEALCVKDEDVALRELNRQLAAASLNCAISEGGNCDRITERLVDVGFDECNSLCAGEVTPESPTVAECIRQLSCFNEGGRMVAGICAMGTCGGDGTSYCGSESGNCPSGQCEPFADSCAAEPLCNTELEAKALVCPVKQRATGAALCQVARHNECTIDSCDSAFDLLSMLAKKGR